MSMQLQTKFGHYDIDRLHNSMSISSIIWAYRHVITFQAGIIILTRLSLVFPCSSKCLMDMGAGLYLWKKIVQKKQKTNGFKQQTCCSGLACRKFQRQAFLMWSSLSRTQFQMIPLDSDSATNPGLEKRPSTLFLSSMYSSLLILCKRNHNFHLSVAPDQGPGQKAKAMGWPHLQLSEKRRKLIKLTNLILNI